MNTADIQARASAALASVLDPESGLGLVDMGLVERVQATEGRIEVDLLTTSAACPMAGLIVEEAEAALAEALGPGWAVAVRIVDEPEWHPGRLSAAAREQLGWTDEDEAALAR